jgi:fucose permease
LRSVIGGMLIGVLCVTVGLLSGSRWLPLISLAGLFYSIVFPTMLVTISSNFPRSRAQAISLILTGTSALLMVYNQLLGLLADKIGYGLSIYLIPLATVLSIVFFIRLKIVTDQIKQESTLK